MKTKKWLEFVATWLIVVSMFMTSVVSPVYAVSTAPSGLFISGIGGTSATISFNSVADATYYELYGSKAGGAESLMATIQESNSSMIDIVFIIDRSGSMGSHITNVKNNINTFASNLAAGGGDYRLGLVTYSDTTYSETINKTNFTNNASTFQSSIGNISLANGGDWRESGLEGIADTTNGGLSFSFRSGASKHFVLVTDAEVHDNSTDGDGGDGKSTYDIDSVAQSLKSQNIKLTVIATNTSSTQTQLSRLSSPTNGAYYYITSSFATSLSTLATNIVTTKQHLMTGLTEYSDYSVRLKACSTVCSAFSTPVTFKTLDATAPTVPSSASTSNKTASSFLLSWTGSTDIGGSGVKEYIVYRNGTAVATIPASAATNYSNTLTGLSATQTYSITIAAKDNAGNTSSLSTALSVNMTDGQAPTAPSNLVASDITTNSLKLTWTASTDNIALTAYEIYQDSTLIVTIPSVGRNQPLTTYDVFGLDADTSYSYFVKAKDSAGNVSFSSNVVTPTTLSDNDAPTALQLSFNKVPESVWVDYEIGAFTTTDENVSDTFTYSLVSGEGDSDNANFTIDEDTLKAAIVFDFAEQELHNIRVRTTDSGGLTYEAMFEIAVAQANVLLNATNKIATIFFDDVIFDNSYNIEVEAGQPKKKLKDLITITNEANVQDPEYLPLGENDTVVVKKDKIVVTFENQITGYYNRIKIANQALKDRFNYVSGEQITTPVVVDVTGPQLVKVTMNKNKRKITMRFSEKVYMATSGAKPTDVAISFKNAITLKRGSGSFATLNAKDKISVGGRFVEITLANEFSTNDNQIQFAAEALKDMLGNKSLEITTPEIEDISGPILNKVTLAPDNKTITVTFDEEAFNTATGTKSEKNNALKNAITLSSDGFTYNALDTNDTTEIIKGVITIKLATALSGSNNRFRFAADSLRDLFTNKNGILVTSALVADSVGPVCKTIEGGECTSASLPSKKMNRTLTIVMNEKISAATTKDNLKAAVQLSTDGTYASLSATDKVSTSNKQLIITFSKALVGGKVYKVKVNAEAMKDFTGNKNLEFETYEFEVDISGPRLR